MSLSIFDEEFQKLRDTDEQLKNRRFRVSSTGSAIYLNFYNLPKNHDGPGAEFENNRMLFRVEKKGDGSLKLELVTSVFPRSVRLRAKTASAEKLVGYLAEFLRKVITEIPPQFTHSEPT